MFRSRSEKIVCLILFAVGLLVFTRGLSIHGLEYRDDEVFYYKSTQEMVRAGNVLSPTYFEEDRFQKPILFYWLILLSYKIFGMGWFGARVVASVFGALCVCVTWLIAKELFTRRVANLSAVILMTVPLFFRHAKNAVPDMPLNFFVVLAVYCAIKFAQDSSRESYGLFFFAACGLGFMIKGFAAVIVPVLTLVVVALIQKRVSLLKEIGFGRGFFIFSLIVLPWFLYMVAVHGSSYLEYMLVDETKNRLLGQPGGNLLWEGIMNYLRHCGFYLKTILSYFAPWSIFFFCAVPLAFVRQRGRSKEKEALQWLLAWIGVVFFFFSGMYFVINHYMMVLTTPFAILVSYFFMEGLDRKSPSGVIFNLSKKYAVLFILTVGFFAFGFLSVFLAGLSRWLLGILVLVYAFLVRFIVRTPKLIAAPFTLGVFLICVFAQSFLMEKAGVTSHSALQKFATTINQEKDRPFIVSVGSHDIHEKEFQVYFDQKIEKAAGSEDQETRVRLSNLFSKQEKVYCLINEKDFERYLNNKVFGPLEVVQEDYIFRKRMNIDRGFFSALIKLDQKRILHYMKEKLILVRRDRNV